MINYAHRGASEYAPENTLSSFYLGLIQGANGIETDVQCTKDGVLVLFHDDTLERVTNGSGRVCDYTLAQLKELKVSSGNTNGFYDRIVTFREFLEKLSCYNISFAIELKRADLEEDVIALMKEFDIMHKSTITSFNFDYLKNVKQLQPDMRIGWLVCDVDDETIARIQEIGGEELAPKAESITAEIVAKLRSLNIGIRAWGIANDKGLMKKMCELNIDGMTINYPDRLFEYINCVQL